MQEYLGAPPKKLLMESPVKNKYFDEVYEPLTLTTSKGRITVPGSKNIKDFLKTDDVEFVDFLQK
jgi:hypothetical protein